MEIASLFGRPPQVCYGNAEGQRLLCLMNHGSSIGHLVAGLICPWLVVLVHMKETSPCLWLLLPSSLNEKIQQPSFFSHVGFLV